MTEPAAIWPKVRYVAVTWAEMRPTAARRIGIAADSMTFRRSTTGKAAVDQSVGGESHDVPQRIVRVAMDQSSRKAGCNVAATCRAGKELMSQTSKSPQRSVRDSLSTLLE